MMRQDTAPEPSDPDILHRAYAHAHSLPGRWRAHYELPLNDERYLDADEDMMLEDLLGVMYATAGQRQAADPLGALRSEMEREGADGETLDRDLLEAFGDEAMKARVQRTAEVPDVPITRVRIGRAVVNHD